MFTTLAHFIPEPGSINQVSLPLLLFFQ